MKKTGTAKGFTLGVITTLVLVLVLSTAVPALAEGIEVVFNTISLVINKEAVVTAGENYTLDDGTEVPNSILYKGTTYIPIRKFANLYDQTVLFGDKTKTAYMFDAVDPDDYPCDMLILEGGDNFRDIGGYTTKDGKTVNLGAFIRSAKLTDLTAADIALITGTYEVSVDLDFRTDEEIQADPDPKLGSAEYANVSIVMDMSKRTFTDMYISAIDGSKDAFRDAFRILADPDNKTVIYHCTNGRDRTGMVTMLLLDLAGVDRATIVEDYNLTEQLSPGTFVRTNESLKNPALTAASLHSPEAIETIYDKVYSEFGGAEGFLKACGVTDQEIANLKTKLLG